MKTYMLDTTTGKLTGDERQERVWRILKQTRYDFAWSPDSKWIAYPRSMANHLHAIFLYSVDSGLVDAGDERDGRFARAGI